MTSESDNITKLRRSSRTAQSKAEGIPKSVEALKLYKVSNSFKSPKSKSGEAPKLAEESVPTEIFVGVKGDAFGKVEKVLDCLVKDSVNYYRVEASSTHE